MIHHSNNKRLISQGRVITHLLLPYHYVTLSINRNSFGITLNASSERSAHKKVLAKISSVSFRIKEGISWDCIHSKNLRVKVEGQ